MEALNNKRTRLRCELEEAYSDWLRTSELAAPSPGRVVDLVDISGCADSLKSKWLAHLETTWRLVEAYAETAIRA